MADMASDNFLGARGRTRIPLRLPVRLRIRDEKSTFPELDARTLVVSKCGAKIECKRPVNVNQEVEVTVTVLPPEERSGIGRVVWCERNRSNTGNFELGVEIREAENLWGITFPPDLSTTDSGEASF